MSRARGTEDDEMDEREEEVEQVAMVEGDRDSDISDSNNGSDNSDISDSNNGSDNSDGEDENDDGSDGDDEEAEEEVQLEGNKAFDVLVKELEGHTEASLEKLKDTVREAREKVKAKRKAAVAAGEEENGEHQAEGKGVMDTAEEAATPASSTARDERLPSKKAKVKQDHGPGRHYTVSIAIPGSLIAGVQSQEVRSHLAGQIARAAVLFQVDEIVVYRESTISLDNTVTEGIPVLHNEHGTGKMRGDPCAFLARVLEYLDCPPFLRKHFFGIHRDLKFASLLPPLEAPHHTVADAPSPFREGVTLKKYVKPGKGSFVDIGLTRPAKIDRHLAPGVRVTVALDVTQYHKKQVHTFRGKAVSPSAPREQKGMYWGYSVRVAESAADVLSECPWKTGYDLCMGITTKRGKAPEAVTMPKSFKHALVIFGGAEGLDEFVESRQAQKRVLHRINTCKHAGTRNIRTEESLLISLSSLSPLLRQHGATSS
ncbi:hypothetical protein PTSG_00362 [Salpingoeca rosetta]|uniref:Uncharacterized protein n=1 Tax=Salpingoeca rosetta (strain ATCC 50818 / BSB-021) TaxID=946362 RepID=F2TW95_SALR5|nr:uncharacterized protein PTSG_00362 [Salpingoeca rosetta]EGD72341.1 hypothetical protein PTSG_00362 [Salpingoeca rosetta]|eukprot:XP_004998911.1 hypothetical protein PTSG_00362 [Salpingoeca rosetta]